MNIQKLKNVLAAHALWLKTDRKEGARADLQGADLSWAELQGANLQKANLQGADLSWANLRGADLSWANLRGANLRGADLQAADLRRADLSWANLRRANLRRADLRGADLRGADLQGANLQGAKLQAANLQGAKLSAYSIVPESGAFIGYKKCREGIVKIEIPADAERVGGLIGRKCRAEEVRVIETPGNVIAHSLCDSEFIYTPGQIVSPKFWNNDIGVECADGIHFFITKKEAEEYNG